MEKSASTVLPVTQKSDVTPPQSSRGRTFKWVVLAAVCFVYSRTWGLESLYSLVSRNDRQFSIYRKLKVPRQVESPLPPSRMVSFGVHVARTSNAGA